MKKNGVMVRVLFVFVKWSDEIENNINVVESCKGWKKFYLEEGENLGICIFLKVINIRIYDCDRIIFELKISMLNVKVVFVKDSSFYNNV